MKQIYLYNGTPVLVYMNENEEYQYPNENWTEIPPPNGIYSPFYFDGSKWIGTERSEWLSKNNQFVNYEPTVMETMLAQTQMQLAKTAVQLQKSQKELAQEIMESVKKDKRIQTLEDEQIKIKEDIANLKGE